MLGSSLLYATSQGERGQAGIEEYLKTKACHFGGLEL
jgi:hypothetical protein